MTIICVKDGVMAVDSLVTYGSLRGGEVRKWVVVHPERGSGYVAAAGALAWTRRLLAVMEQPEGDVPPTDEDGAGGLWLLPDGLVREWVDGLWVAIDAPFHAHGSGFRYAMGAMAFGASAVQAVKVACDLDVYCGGAVHILSVA